MRPVRFRKAVLHPSMQFCSTAFTFNEHEARLLALGLTTFAALLAEVDTDDERRKRKLRVVGLKLDLLRKVGLDVSTPAGGDCSRGCSELVALARAEVGARATLTAQISAWDETKRNALLIEIAFADPFAPYEIKVRSKDHAEQLALFCPAIGLAPERAGQVLESMDAARKAHRNVAWGKIAVPAVLGAVVVAAGGYAGAPLITEHLGAVAGLSGAAAVSHGLALLGGGSLAVGGAGVAGGMALVTAASTTVGAASAGGAAALWNAGCAAAVGELIKLQVSYKEVLLRAQPRSPETGEVVESLLRHCTQLESKLEEERTLNDAGAQRVKELERILLAYRYTIQWLSRQVSDANSPAGTVDSGVRPWQVRSSLPTLV
jgi:hypothetical protein